MDWEPKTSACDFTDDPRLVALVGSNSLSPNNNRRGDFSNDLKLGRLGDTRDDNNVKLQKCSSSLPLGSSKRARAVSGLQDITCVVDGCSADLSECREYHRRHRVCERHSKTPVVFVGCKEQRFCQQCSRFHSLAEFDDEKRSCRKRLDGHNRRRRKPQPEAFYLNHGSFLSNHQGTRLLQFGSPNAYTSAVPTWPSVHKHHSATFPNSIPTVQNDKRFPFLLINEPERTNHHHHANMHQDRAHSLLSLPSYSAQLGPIGSQFGYPHPRSPPPMVSQANGYHNSYSGSEIATMSLSPDDLLEKGASQVLPFSWK